MSRISSLLEELTKEELLIIANECLNMYKGSQKIDNKKSLNLIITSQANSYNIGFKDLYDLVLKIAKERNILL